ncbi:FAD-binding oxidoreductase [Paenibacillus sp. F411]|uniref:NAD(P)/FAD-dependent oxidoreductase n=1 Tax=Paenibacillus sp. F411 TaxID=2820239 RepID=UPI001AB00F74|nr:FAD-binding oxidoreductase [Paenibacillus sp. F411]MBO2942877.1 FAD-binding oxidoreductase [Paenibacillus sp. F411]
MTQKAIVIGAGILGASAAYHLASQGAEVLIIDRADPGQATAAAAGIICPWLSQRRNKAWYQLAKAGAAFYPDLVQALEQEGESDTGYAQVGAISIHEDEAKIRLMQERAALRKGEAPEIGQIRSLSEAETRSMFPLLKEGYRSVHISGAARVDGRALRDALLRAARNHGAKLLHGEAVLEVHEARVTGARVGEASYSADEVLVCAGAWADELLQPLGIPFQISHQKAQIMHLKVNSIAETGTWPVVIPPTDQYLLAFDEQRIVMGATHENDASLHDTAVTAGGMQEILNKGLELAPALVGSTLQEVRVGFRPFTPGFLPVIGRMPGWKGLLAANGLGASGLTVGPFLGRQLARLALGEEPELDLSPYDLTHAISEAE